MILVMPPRLAGWLLHKPPPSVLIASPLCPATSLPSATKRPPCPFLQNRSISDVLHASIVAWQVGRSVFSTEPNERTLFADQWVTKRLNPRRRRIAHGIRYGFLAGLGGEPAEPAWSSSDYIAAYEAAWNVGNAMAIDSDPR